MNAACLVIELDSALVIHCSLDVIGVALTISEIDLSHFGVSRLNCCGNA